MAKLTKTTDVRMSDGFEADGARHAELGLSDGSEWQPA